MRLEVALVVVDEDVLRSLLEVAVHDAAADEVTPPLTPGPLWTETRQQWFLDYHRARRDQLHGPAAESTWAVMVDGRPVGAVRLQRGAGDSTVETGIWLARSARGRGIGTRALTGVVALARASGATTVVADTAAANLPARAAMRSAGFHLARATPDGRVHGSLDVRAPG